MNLQLLLSVLFVPGFHALLPTQLVLMLYYCPSRILGYTCETSDCQSPHFLVRFFSLAHMLLAGPSRKAVQVSRIDLTLSTSGAGRPHSILVALVCNCRPGGIALECEEVWTPAACPFLGTVPLLLIFLSPVASSLPPESMSWACWAASVSLFLRWEEHLKGSYYGGMTDRNFEIPSVDVPGNELQLCLFSQQTYLRATSW